MRSSVFIDERLGLGLVYRFSLENNSNLGMQMESLKNGGGLI